MSGNIGANPYIDPRLRNYRSRYGAISND
ncbi:phage anti-RecBCD protein [Escherichia coli]|nr:phage anti-RecBCD protein [Escherichia coli]